MILRPYQEVAISDALNALDTHKNTIVVAPTGAGKTIMLSALIGKRHPEGKRILLLQELEELVAQNSEKFLKVKPKAIPHSPYTQMFLLLIPPMSLIFRLLKTGALSLKMPSLN